MIVHHATGTHVLQVKAMWILSKCRGANMPKSLQTIGYNAHFPRKFEMVFRKEEKAETGKLKREG